jgi:D-alanyl-D-alanine carboxypeptidase/Transglycosylase-like domain
MKKVFGVVVAGILALLIGLAAIPYAIGIALQSLSQIDDNNCGVIFAATTFTPQQIVTAYAPATAPIDPKLIADALTGAALDLGPDFDAWFTGTRTIPIGPDDKDASINNPNWAPLLKLRPTAGEDADREGPDVPEPFVPITATEINTAFTNKPPADATVIATDLNTGFTTYSATIDAWFAGNGTLWIAAGARSITDPKWAPLKTFAGRKPQPPPPKSPAVTMNRVLATIRQLESSNNYQADTASGSASGAYQFTNETWGHFRGYARAVNAPPGIQDERAAIAVGAVLQKYGLEAVPVSWYWPLALRNPSWMDRIPRPDYGNTLTVRQYQQKWLAAYAGIANGIYGGGVGPCQPGTGGGGDIGPVSNDSEQREVSGSCTTTFTVHQSIAAQTHQLLNAACADHLTFGGWGWRSPQSQIDLRRAHCGPTHNDIYNKPSNQCRPPTARPGNSMHERGKAIDFNSAGNGLTRGSRGYRWLAINAKRFGYFNLPSEPWHWSENGR